MAGMVWHDAIACKDKSFTQIKSCPCLMGAIAFPPAPYDPRPCALAVFLRLHYSPGGDVRWPHSRGRLCYEMDVLCYGTTVSVRSFPSPPE